MTVMLLSEAFNTARRREKKRSKVERGGGKKMAKPPSSTASVERVPARIKWSRGRPPRSFPYLAKTGERVGVELSKCWEHGEDSAPTSRSRELKEDFAEALLHSDHQGPPNHTSSGRRRHGRGQSQSWGRPKPTRAQAMTRPTRTLEHGGRLIARTSRGRRGTLEQRVRSRGVRNVAEANLDVGTENGAVFQRREAGSRDLCFLTKCRDGVGRRDGSSPGCSWLFPHHPIAPVYMDLDACSLLCLRSSRRHGIESGKRPWCRGLEEEAEARLQTDQLTLGDGNEDIAASSFIRNLSKYSPPSPPHDFQSLPAPLAFTQFMGKREI